MLFGIIGYAAGIKGILRIYPKNQAYLYMPGCMEDAEHAGGNGSERLAKNVLFFDEGLYHVCDSNITEHCRQPATPDGHAY